MNASDELLLLGLLRRQAMHGYALNEFLQHRLRFVSSLKKPTAYRLLDRLYQQGLVERETERQGRRPERMVYRLTEAGQQYFQLLLREQLATPELVVYPLDAVLLFWDELSVAERRHLLDLRLEGLRQQIEEVREVAEAHQPATPARLALEHCLAHLEVERAWIHQLAAALHQPALADQPSGSLPVAPDMSAVSPVEQSSASFGR